MKIDFHTHIFPKNIRQRREDFFAEEPAFELLYGSEKSKMVGAKELIESMDEQGIDKSVIFGFPWRNPGLISDHNDYIKDSIEKYPSRFIGFCCFDLSYEKATSEVIRCLDAGFSGVGELATYKNKLGNDDLKRLGPVMSLCREKNLPLLFHVNEPVGHFYPGKSENALADAYTLIKTFPENIIVLAHWGGGLFFYSLMKKEVKDLLKNVYFDTAASPFLYDKEIYQQAIRLSGAERILFGSDYPLIKPERYFAEMSAADLTSNEIESICGNNALALLNQIITHNGTGTKA